LSGSNPKAPGFAGGYLPKDDPHFDDELRAFLGGTYGLKAIADYQTGPGSQVSVEQAQQAIATSRRFIEIVAILIGAEPNRSR
jgi:hypothetical protein